MNTRRTAHSQHCTSATRRSLLKTGAIGAVAGVAMSSRWRVDSVDAAPVGNPRLAIHPWGAQTTEGGFSTSGLERMHETMTGLVDNGVAPGLVTLIGRDGEIHADAIGTMAVDGGEPMRRDTIFRIASVTKPITAVAAMILVEEGMLGLDAPVDGFLPELADRQVLRSLESEVDDTVPAERPLTPRDLLTFRSGYGLIFDPPGTYPIQEAIAASGAFTNIETGEFLPQLPADELMAAYGELPLLHQPGEAWLYNSGSDLLGVLIARASGMSLGEFMRERIFAPLGMVDTGFSVPADKLDRLPPSYWTNPETGEPRQTDGVDDSLWASPPIFESGAGGLVSTADDLLAFGQMMRNTGAYPGGRILSRPSVELMTIDHITPEQKAASPYFPFSWDNLGWGFGVSVVTRRDDLRSVGWYGWYGGTGTAWGVDPREGLVGILLTQSVDVLFSGAIEAFWTATYAAFAD
jgi:CubicO group peptidase (beta-lactamase class C family)